MTYNIIKDEEELKKFIEWLPDLEQDEGYYISLLCRRKYNSDKKIPSNMDMIKRTVTSKKHLLMSIRQFEIKKGQYSVNEIELDDEALAMYILPNPRSYRKTWSMMAMNAITFLENNQSFPNPESYSLSCLAKCPSKKRFIDVDIDLNEGDEISIESLYEYLDDKINKDAIDAIIRTRGGYHVLINQEKILIDYKKTWYSQISEMKNDKFKDVSINSDRMLPIPGCIQGGFVPKIYFN